MIEVIKDEVVFFVITTHKVNHGFEQSHSSETFSIELLQSNTKHLSVSPT